MAASKREKEISAAGRELEHALGLAGSSNTLARWMVYRLAELRETAASATDSAIRRTAQNDHDALILALWAQRSSLPVGVAADQRLGKSLALLDALIAEQEFWHPSCENPKAPEAILAAMKGAVVRVGRPAVALLYERDAMTAGPEDPDLPLNDDERKIRTLMSKLRSTELRDSLPQTNRSSAEDVGHEEAAAALERKVDSEIDGFARLLEALRAALLAKPAPPTRKVLKSKPKAASTGRTSTSAPPLKPRVTRATPRSTTAKKPD